jgi:leucyl/phenylalanyl-tRNA--protein transferase
MHRLCAELVGRGFHMIDCQMATPHLLSLGAQLIPRTDFVQQLAERTTPGGEPGRWLAPAS